MSEHENEGPRITDRRRVDPDSGEVRRPAEPAGAASAGDGTDSEELLAQAVDAALADADVAGAGARDQVAELTADLQRVHAEYANYRKRVDRDREAMNDLAAAAVVAVESAASEAVPSSEPQPVRASSRAAEAATR